MSTESIDKIGAVVTDLILLAIAFALAIALWGGIFYGLVVIWKNIRRR